MNNQTMLKYPYSPISNQAILSEVGVGVASTSESYIAPIGELVQEALNWLKNHPQLDEKERFKTFHLMQFYAESQPIELAGALLADLSEKADLTEINPFIKATAKNYSEHFDAKSIEQETSEISCLTYRIFRTLAELDCAIDDVNYSHAVPHRPTREALIRRWKAIAQSMRQKPLPFRAYAEELLNRLYWFEFQFFTAKAPVYRLSAQKQVLDQFSEHFSDYLLLHEIRADDSTLYIRQPIFTVPVITRLIDGLSFVFRDSIHFELAQNFKDVFPYIPHEHEEYMRVDTIAELLSNAFIIRPVDYLLSKNRCHDNRDEIKRLSRLATGEAWDPWEHVKNPDTLFTEEQIRLKELAPESFISPLTWFKQHPKEDLYFLGFNLQTNKMGLPFCSIDNIPARKEIMTWIEQNLPEIKLEPFMRVDEDGDVKPYCGEIALIGPQQSIKKFSDYWEDEVGNSLDPRFCLYRIPFDSVLV